MAAEQVGSDGGAEVASFRSLLRPFVVEALAAPTGPELLTALLELPGRAQLSAREWVEVCAAFKSMVGFCTAGQLNAVTEVDRALTPTAAGTARPGRSDPVRAAADELAPALRIAPRTASHLVALTRRLEGLPAAADALVDGRMDLAQVRVLDQVVRDLPGPAATQVEAAAVAWAPRRTAQQLHADLAAEAMRVDPAHAAFACARGVAERDVTFRASRTPGCGRLVADLPWSPARRRGWRSTPPPRTPRSTGSARTAHPRTGPWPSFAPTSTPPCSPARATRSAGTCPPPPSSPGWPRCRSSWPPTP